MPLYKSIAVNNETHILIWEITESETNLNLGIQLGEYSKNRLSKMKSELHRRAYLSVRHLLAIAQYTDEDLTYSITGKPSLSDNVYISITHSNQYAAIILGAHPVGIDIEKQRSKIEHIAQKFITEKENAYLLKSKSTVKTLTAIWGAKEALYKLYGKAGLSFKQHIEIAPFEDNEKHTRGSIYFEEKLTFFDIHITDFNNFTCVYSCN